MAGGFSPRGGWRRRRGGGAADFGDRLRPPQFTVAAFGCAVLVGTLLLMLPAASAGGRSADVLTALFTAVSAVCVTGLAVVDTAVYWSTAGQVVILALIQVGGFGIMTLATLLGAVVTRRLSLRTQIRAGAEAKSLTLGEVRRLVGGIARVTAVFEVGVAAVLAARFALAYGESPGRAVYLGVFHSVSAFNNAGFALFSDNLEGFATDPWICLPIAVAVIAGGLGFPVWLELWRHARRVGGAAPRHWSLHARITLLGTAALLAVGFAAFCALEWRNPATLGPLSVPGKVLAAFFQAVMPRTAGFNSLPFGEMNTQTLFVTDVLMFIGGGSAGTAGGIKVTTFTVLAFVIYANMRGEGTVHIGRRRLPADVERQAVTVVLLALGLVCAATFALMTMTLFTLDQLLFEVVSAFATVGLSTGITADLPAAGQLILVALMFIGRVGPATLASALALRHHGRRYAYAEERLVVG